MGFRSVMKTAFPFIAAALSAGGPLGTMATSALSKGLGIELKKDEDVDQAIANLSATNPDAIAKLKEIENNFQIQMTQLGFDQVEKMEALAVSDRASARNREIAVRDKMPMILALAVTGGFFAVFVIIIKVPIPTAVHDLVLIMLGGLAGNFNSVINYFFGSSSGSATKTDILAKTKQ